MVAAMAEPVPPAAPAPAAAPHATGAHAYVVAAHPDWRESRVNRRLLQAARSVPGARVLDLYGRYPDYAIDVAAEQQALEAAPLLVLLHPVQWYAMPALLKLWVDEVFALGWAYGPGGTALRGKDLWLVASTGGSEASYHPQGYNRYFFDAFLPPYEQTAALCGMRFLPPLLLHGAHRVDDAALHVHAETFAQRLASWPRWPEIAELGDGVSCEVPTGDRPAPHPEDH